MLPRLRPVFESVRGRSWPLSAYLHPVSSEFPFRKESETARPEPGERRSEKGVRSYYSDFYIIIFGVRACARNNIVRFLGPGSAVSRLKQRPLFRVAAVGFVGRFLSRRGCRRRVPVRSVLCHGQRSAGSDHRQQFLFGDETYAQFGRLLEFRRSDLFSCDQKSTLADTAARFYRRALRSVPSVRRGCDRRICP